MTRHPVLCIASLIPFLLISPLIQAKPMKAFILAGQSNMDGWGTTADLPPEWLTPQENVPFFLTSKWSPLKPGSTRFGPEVSFGKAMAEAWPDETVAIIKYAYGGTSLLAWDPFWTSGEATVAGDQAKGILYQVLMSEIELAHRLEERKIDIAGMLWMQGESDSLFAGPAQDYFKNFKEFIENIRHDTGRPNLPFVFGRISQAAAWTYKTTVRAAQAQAEREIPFTQMVDTDDLPFIADGIHYNATGQIELGRRFAQAILEIAASEQAAPKATRFIPGMKGPQYGWFAVGDVFTASKLHVSVPNSADTEILESIPAGWHVSNLRPSRGQAIVEGDRIHWVIPNFTGEAELSYDLQVEFDTGDGVMFAGTIQSGERIRGIDGLPQAHSTSGTTALAPLLSNSVQLDGRLDPAEWENAFSATFDRSNKIAPGVAVLGPLSVPEDARATFYLFHDGTRLYGAVDVTDPKLSFGSAARASRYGDCLKICLDGNSSRSRPENTALGFAISIVGDGSDARGALAPTEEPLPEGGFHSTDGQLWNYGANVRPDGSGYIVEFACETSALLDTPERKTIGFDIEIIDNAESRSFLSKWAWCFVDDISGLPIDAELDESGWGRLEFLDGPLAAIGDWSIY